MSDWNEWRGGECPVLPDEPVEVLWPNGLSRVYCYDHVVWDNLKTDGSVKWRRPKPPKPEMPRSIWVSIHPLSGDLLAQHHHAYPAKGAVLYVRQD